MLFDKTEHSHTDIKEIFTLEYCRGSVCAKQETLFMLFTLELEEMLKKRIICSNRKYFFRFSGMFFVRVSLKTTYLVEI